MEKNDDFSRLQDFIGRLNFTTVETLQPSAQGDEMFIVTKRTKCQNLFLSAFGDELYNLMDCVDQTDIDTLKAKFFSGTLFKGVVTPADNVQRLSSEVYDHADIIGSADKSVDPEKFVDVIRQAFGISSDEMVSNHQRLKWKGSARKLGFVVRFLCDLDLIETPYKGDEVNCQELANQVLSSFDVKSELQNMRKSVDPDKNKLSENQQNELRDKIYQAVKNFPES